MKISPPAWCILCVLVCVQSDTGAGPHQERQNRLLPDFEPFDHPSKKIEDSATTKGSKGPISEVEWVEEVVPVFGKIQIQKKVGTADYSSNKMPLILTLVVGGCLLCGVLAVKQTSSVEQNKGNKQRENLREIPVNFSNIRPEVSAPTVSRNQTGNHDGNISLPR